MARIQAQDEAVYGSTSLTMAAKGGWITPMFLGRYALYKPPMLYWLSALSVRVLGRDPLALRAPSLLSGAATVTVIFCWLRTATPLLTAFAGALLLLSSHMFFVLSRVGLTDALLTFEMTCAMFALARDPRLESRACLGIFGCASGAAIMTKGVAGLFSLLGLGVFWLLSWQRPNWKRLMQVFAITAALALPWHLWQLYRHPHWFWAEYVLTEHWTWGFGSVPQITDERHILYYLERLVAVDPILVLAALAAFTRSRPRVPVCLAATEFVRLDEVRPVYAERLRRFDLDSAEPVATVIRARSEEEIADLIISHPETDFYVPGKWVDRDRGVHAVWRSEQGRVFLLSGP